MASDITWAVKEITKRARDIDLFQRYYRGEHRPAYATEKWESAFGQVFRKFRDNLCPAVVNTKSDRLQITGFDTGNESTDAKAQDIWTANRMDRRAGEVHTGALRDGDAFVIVWPGKDGQPKFYPQRAERMAVRWSEDEPGLVEIAAKCWPVESYEEKSKWRLTLYYPDRIERYITRQEMTSSSPDLPTKDDSWMEFSDPDVQLDDTSRGWLLKNDYAQVPVFPWNNDAMTGEYGRSELQDVIPLQDALNKTVADSLIAGEFAAVPQRWATGLEVPIGADGRPVQEPFEAAVDRIWNNPNANGRFGQFEAANMQGFVTTADGYRAEIARVSRTPLHYLLLSGQFPSGEALRAAEAPLMAVVSDRQIGFGNSWEDAMLFALKIAGANADSISANWKDTTSVADSEKLDGLTKKAALGVPNDQLWKEMGYDDDQVKDFTEKADQRAADARAAFGAGVPTTTDLTGGAAPMDATQAAALMNGGNIGTPLA